ncbi:MAG: TonB-dependent receptor plug domain-containing protein [Bacteroidales bacterium]|nr:TonB-dependent receptor plug domain-containing protein [Bacteroidales bacterium]
MNRKFLLLLSICLSVTALRAQTDTTKINDENSVSEIATIVLSDSDLEEDSQDNDISTLLQSSSDVYVNMSGYTFGQARFRFRGYDNQNAEVLLNGICVNDAENGRASYSNWGGLNDVTRFKTNTSGLGFSDYSFGGLAGVTNLSTRVAEFRAGTSISYANSNKSYHHRLMASHNTGLMANGWAFSASASMRLALTSYVPGTFYEGYAYFFGAEKKFNDKHSLGLVFYGSPSRNGKSSAATAEAYELAGTNFYNPNWGYQNGKVRNAKIGNYHQPRIILSHYWDIDNSLKLQTSASYLFGRGGTTALNWYDAPDPRPDYYRNFPSYYDEDDANYDLLTYEWQNNESQRTLDWDQFYFANLKNLYTVTNVGGNPNDSITGNRAKYIVEERRNDISRFDFNSRLSKVFTDEIKMVAGVNYMMNQTHYFKVIDDLLGADWWLDVDQFAERDFNDENYIQSDLDNPNQVKKEGDVFGYNYIANTHKADAFAEAEFKYSKIEFFGALKLSYTEYWRKGLMRNGKFPDNSYGNSEHHRFLNYAAKAGLNYKITGRNFLILNGIYQTRAPYFRNAYVSPRTRDNVVNNLKSETIFSADLSYLYRSPIFQIKLTGYYTEFRDGAESISFYHDELNTFVNYTMTDVDKVHYGGELGAEVKITPTITATAAVGYGKYLYNNRPTVTITQDNSSEVLATDRIVYLKNYHIGGTPELASSIGMKYSSPKYWYIGFNANYFGENYVTINPEKHTSEALDIYVTTDPQLSQILEQEKLKGGFTLDVYGGASWKLKHKYTLGFTLSLSNVTNNRKIATSGFEQYRFDKTNIDKFPNKYYYMTGFTYFLNLYLRF